VPGDTRPKTVLEHLASLPAAFRQAREDAGFQRVLVRLARTGTVVGAGLGISAVLLFVGVYTVVMGKSLGWTYAENHIALWDKAVLLVLCTLALTLARQASLGGARLLVALLVTAGTIASVADDVAAGDTSFSPGYLTFMYLLAVAAVPFRPLQTLGLGVALSVSMYAGVEWLPGLLGEPPLAQMFGHYVYLAIITVTLSGISGLLYIGRYRQYQARREAEQLREQVQTLEAAKSRFFANISHEFRTPLTLLLGPLDDALTGRYGPLSPVLRRRLREMHIQAHELRELVNQLLDLSKLDAGAMPLRARPHDLTAFVKRQVELFRAALTREEITLLIDMPEDRLPAWFDAEKMTRVLTNLLSNALKHTPAGGTVRVHLTTNNSEAVLAVRDSGDGLAPDVLATVFDRFMSGNRDPSGTASTGIGLALVKEIVERHGGRVDVRSESGFGAEFIVHLPLSTDHLAPSDVEASELPATEPTEATPPLSHPHDPETEEPAPPEPPDDAPTILVVDDDKPVRDYIRDVLGGTYHVMEAADGEEAWALLHNHLPALVISDVMMPRLDGFALCRRIRDDERLATMPVVFLTARAEEEARVEGWKTGADAYLTKPFSGNELSAVAENVIEVRQLLRTRVKVPDWMETNAPDVPSPDAEFLDRVQQAVGEHIDNTNFGVEWLADEVGLSARQLQRRLKKLTRLTAASFIKTMRLEHAARLLAENNLQVQQVAHAVGYEDANYFSRLFRQAYGVPPSEYVKEAT